MFCLFYLRSQISPWEGCLQHTGNAICSILGSHDNTLTQMEKSDQYVIVYFFFCFICCMFNYLLVNGAQPRRSVKWNATMHWNMNTSDIAWYWLKHHHKTGMSGFINKWLRLIWAIMLFIHCKGADWLKAETQERFSKLCESSSLFPLLDLRKELFISHMFFSLILSMCRF